MTLDAGDSSHLLPRHSLGRPLGSGVCLPLSSRSSQSTGKIKDETSTTTLPGIDPKELNAALKCLYVNIHINAPRNSQTVKTTQMLINCQMGKVRVACPYNGTVLRNRKDQSTDTCTNINGPQCGRSRKKKGLMSCDSVYMTFLNMQIRLYKVHFNVLAAPNPDILLLEGILNSRSKSILLSRMESEIGRTFLPLPAAA